MIKLFEEYNEYYKEITYDEYSSYFDVVLFLTRDEIKRLGKVFKDHSVVYDSHKRVFKRSFVPDGVPTTVGYIDKLPDEWYLVYYRYKHYKCDQMEGLIKLLEDKL